MPENPDAGGETATAALRDRLQEVEARAAAACRRSGRPREEVLLMAVSKQHPLSAILEAASLGISRFGENRVPEFQQKHAELEKRGEFELARRFHCIGHVQSNKAQRAAGLFASIDTLDSVRLALKLNDAAAERGEPLPVMVEIKLSHEPAKSGLEPESVELQALLERLPDLHRLSLMGLMTVPPFTADAEAARPYFRRLRLLRDSLAVAHPRLRFDALSMGMSHDFPVAIEEGATVIRVGTALFGRRRPAAPLPVC